MRLFRNLLGVKRVMLQVGLSQDCSSERRMCHGDGSLKNEQITDTRGMKNEVVIARSHRNFADHP